MRTKLRTFSATFASLAVIVIALVSYFWFGMTPWLIWFVSLFLCFTAAYLVQRTALHSLRLLTVRAQILSALISAALVSLLLVGGLEIIRQWHVDSGSPLLAHYFVAMAFVSLLMISDILKRDARQKVQLERQMADLRLNALQAQIEPHFLYNTLANVQQLVRSSPSDADGMLTSLIRYLKAAVPEIRSGRATLGQEADRAEAYLKIMSIRMGTRLCYELDISTSLRHVAVPPLSLMTLVENAVKHGIDAKPEGGTLRIKAALNDGLLCVRVIDDGAGFHNETGSGTGLQNLRERLLTLYGNRASLELNLVEPTGVEAVLVLPYD